MFCGYGFGQVFLLVEGGQIFLKEKFFGLFYGLNRISKCKMCFEVYGFGVLLYEMNYQGLKSGRERNRCGVWVVIVVEFG